MKKLTLVLMSSVITCLSFSQKTTKPVPIDPQQVRDQDDMTWEDYKPIPGQNWADPNRKATGKTFRIAIVTADFSDQPFVMTLPKQSDPYGNPQIAPVKREQIPQFYADFWNKPQSINKGHTIHEYWMEQSRGSFGISVKAFGPYRMSQKSFQYGGMQQADMPEGYQETNRRMNPEIDSLWRAENGANIKEDFDVILRIFAGYDETCVWQEFGEMKFQNKEDITPAWGNPDPTKKPWVKTRYTEWTSWRAGSWLWSNSAIIQGESSGSIRHEISHFAFKIPDNNNNPYILPFRRAGVGPWDVMDRGSFNGPGGPHRRWLIPVMEGGAMPAGLMLRQKISYGFLKKEDVLYLNRNGLASSGIVVANVTSREVAPGPNSFAGIHIRLDGEAPLDKTPADDPNTNPLSAGIPNYTFYSMEAIQRIGYDSYTPDNGVLLAKNKDNPSNNGGGNSFTVFNWAIDAVPEDKKLVDFKRPDGTPVLRTIADYRQLNDALFHAGLNSGSQYEWEDTYNRLHFYVVDLHKDANGVRSYTLAVRSLDGNGPQTRGVALTAPASATAGKPVNVTLKNTGTTAATAATLHPQDASAYLESDVYRLSVTVEGKGWSAELLNALAAVKAGASKQFPVYVDAAAGASATGTVTVTATSESDPSKTMTTKFTVKK